MHIPEKPAETSTYSQKKKGGKKKMHEGISGQSKCSPELSMRYELRRAGLRTDLSPPSTQTAHVPVGAESSS